MLFARVSEHFFWNGDEECLRANDGDVHILGDKGKKKHEVIIADARLSITLYRCGNAAGTSGPTIFLPAGERIKTGFTDKFLLEHGAALGSTMFMTPTGFLTKEAWCQMVEYICIGIRAAPVVCDHPDWWVIKTLDGFWVHVNCPEGLEIFHRYKVMLLKEEGDSSQVNQPFDRRVAKTGKVDMRWALGILRNSTNITKGVLTQWDLIHVGLAALRQCLPAAWISSFISCNLNPKHRKSFQEWVVKIKHFLHSGQTFKCDTAVDKYALLPAFWHGMSPDEKQQVVRVVDESSESDAGLGAWTPACLRKLNQDCHIPMKDMQHIRLCYIVGKELPETLSLSGPLENAAEHAMQAQEKAQSQPSLRLTVQKNQPTKLRMMQHSWH